MKKWKKYLIVTLLLLSTLVGCSAPLFKQADREQQAFNLYLDDLIQLRNEITMLTPFEKKIIEQRYINDFTQQETAKK